MEIFTFLYSRRVATYDQIAERFFKYVDSSIIRRRLLKLKAAGYLSTGGISIGSHARPYFRLTPKAWPLIRDRLSVEVDRPLFESESPLHDICATEVFAKLEKVKLFDDIFSENMLQSSSALAEEDLTSALSKLQADGALILKTESGHRISFGIEFEMTKKSNKRYTEKMTAYYLASGISGVIYICRNMEILKAVANADSEVRGEGRSRLHFAIESTVLNAEKELIFQNAKIDGIRLELRVPQDCHMRGKLN